MKANWRGMLRRFPGRLSKRIKDIYKISMPTNMEERWRLPGGNQLVVLKYF